MFPTGAVLEKIFGGNAPLNRSAELGGYGKGVGVSSEAGGV